MNNKLYSGFLVFLIISILVFPIISFTSCKTGTEMEWKQDSIFWDFHFGMSRVKFYEICADLNKQKKVIQGSKNVSVAYIDTTSFKSQVEVNFYPEFNADDKINKMPVRMNYSFWAPWNIELRADSLVAEVVHQFKKEDGLEFKSGKDKFQRPMFIHKNGPKTITVKNEDDYYILVTYENNKY